MSIWDSLAKLSGDVEILQSFHLHEEPASSLAKHRGRWSSGAPSLVKQKIPSFLKGTKKPNPNDTSIFTNCTHIQQKSS